MYIKELSMNGNVELMRGLLWGWAALQVRLDWRKLHERKKGGAFIKEKSPDNWRNKDKITLKITWISQPQFLSKWPEIRRPSKNLSSKNLTVTQGLVHQRSLQRHNAQKHQQYSKVSNYQQTAVISSFPDSQTPKTLLEKWENELLYIMKGNTNNPINLDKENRSVLYWSN